MMSKLFGGGKPKKTNEELAKEWKGQLKQQQRDIEKQIRQITQAEQQVKMELKKLLKKDGGAGGGSGGGGGGIRLLAKELAKTQRDRERLETTVTQLNSIGMQLNEQMAMVRVSGHFAQSTNITKLMSACMSKQLPELSKNMANLQKEMITAGLMQEMVGDAMDDALMPNEDILEEEKIDAILAMCGAVPLESASPSLQLPASPTHELKNALNAEEADPVQERMLAQLNALR